MAASTASFDPWSAGIGGAFQLGGAALQADGMKTSAALQRKSAKETAAAGFLGDFISRDDARAGRFAVDRQNTFNAFVNPLFNTPIDYGYQLAAKKDDLYNFRPQEYALERQRNFLEDERKLNPIVRQNAANELKLAGKYRGFQKMLESPYGPYVPIPV